MAWEIWYILKDKYVSRVSLFVTILVILFVSLALFAVFAILTETPDKHWYHDVLAVIMLFALPALCAKIYKKL